MVENFGLYLKHERELRGVALEEIAETTKIHIRFLEALENNDYDNMPGEVFVKGFIRSYAKVIGFDSEELVNAYDESVGKGRREEQEKVQNTNEKNHSRKKAMAGYLLGGISLAIIFTLGYLVFDQNTEDTVDENNQARVEGLPVEGPAPEAENPSISSEPPPSDETESVNTGKESQEPLVESKQNTAPSKDTEARSKPKIENVSPPAPTTQPIPKNISAEASNREVTSSEAESSVEASEDDKKMVETSGQEVASLEPQSSVEASEAEEEKMEDVSDQEIARPKPETLEEASAPEEEKTGEPETPEKPAEMKKDSALLEKPVIIQQVMGETESSADSGESVPEPDAKSLELKIQVQGNSWFNITVDDTREEDFILPGGTTKNVYGSEKIRLTIGNRNGTALFLNGKAIDLPPGSNDVIRNFDITANLLE